MAKQIQEFLGMDEKKDKPQSKVYYLDDILDKDPTLYCPNCDSCKIQLLHTHNEDGYDYQCNKCKFLYEIILCNRGDDF
ncbi:MAG: hypothetical protein PHH54_01255 [Candidatus Nanoarchaeia archaeon]|nr:hypothetical protein [Candidatus Nanoarchaeia archaeon]MDD5740590.1 hypothetical protein [Candidatus Nanoarchaeia archaeon]